VNLVVTLKKKLEARFNDFQHGGPTRHPTAEDVDDAYWVGLLAGAKIAMPYGRKEGMDAAVNFIRNDAKRALFGAGLLVEAIANLLKEFANTMAEEENQKDL
jgi:hypothetical protein